MQINITSTTSIVTAFSSDHSPNVLPWAMSNLVQIRVAADASDGFDSPAKQKAANRSSYSNRPFLSLRRAKQFLGAAKFKLFLVLFALSIVVFVSSRLSSWMGWNPHHSSSVSSTSRYIKKIRSVFLCNFTFFFYLLLFTRCLFLGGLLSLACLKFWIIMAFCGGTFVKLNYSVSPCHKYKAPSPYHSYRNKVGESHVQHNSCL